MSNIKICPPHFTSPHFPFSFNFLKLTATTANFFTICCCCCIGIVILLLLVGNFYPMLRVNFTSI